MAGVHDQHLPPAVLVDGVGFDDLDARLARIGYTPITLATQFDAKPAEIRRFLKGKLDSDRTTELADAMRSAGLPL
jgi:hypothetical protein